MRFSANDGSHFMKSNIVGRYFAAIFKDFAQIFRNFARIFKDFARIFDISKLLGSTCTPCTPASYTTNLRIKTLLRET